MLFGILTITGALLGLGLALWTKREAQEQFGWPRAEGTVTAIECGFMTRYHVSIDYVFSFGGRRFGGNQICEPDFSFNTPFGVSETARRVLMKYPKGAKVTVFVNPSDPEKSVLEPGGNARFVPIAVGFALLWIALGALAISTAL